MGIKKLEGEKRRLVVDVPESHHTALDMFSKKNDVSISSIVRKMVKEWFEERGVK